MSDTTIFSTSPSMYKKANNHNDPRSKVREAVRKYDIPPSPSLSHQSSIPIKVNNNNNNTHINETLGSSNSSLTNSITSDYVEDQNTTEQKRSVSGDKSIPDSITVLTKPHISTARIEIRPPTQHKPTPQVRRILPSTPQDVPESKQEPIYVNHHNDFEQNGFTHQHLGSKLRNSSYRNGIEKPSPSSIQNRSKNSDLEIDEPTFRFQRQTTIDNGYPNDNTRHLSFHSTSYETADFLERHRSYSPPPPPSRAFVKSFLPNQRHDNQEELQSYIPKRTLPLSNFLMEFGALVIVFIVCMVLALAIREDETQLRITMQIVYSYIYLVSIIWMIWCTFDIIKFRRQWTELTASANDTDEYMDMTERHSHNLFYFPDTHNTGGLFMRIGAGLLCMGGLILTVLEIAKTIARIGNEEIPTRTSSTIIDPLSVLITKLITYIFRFIFHCVQFLFLFRYGNLVINRYHFIAKIGLIHIVIANFCTCFEAIVIETLDQMNKNPDTHTTTTVPTTVTPSNETNVNSKSFDFLKTLSVTSFNSITDYNPTALEILYELESSMAVYLYPFLIEYSLISLTVFFIMWRNVGKHEKRSFVRFGNRHLFTINCSRASRGLLIGGIIFLLTLVALIPAYLLEEGSISVTQITGFVLLIVSLFTVCLSYFYTTTLFYDRHAHVNIFDQVLIIITTLGDFAYSFFGLFASIFVKEEFVVESKWKLPIGIQISIGFLGIFQTFLQSSFIMDTLKRRTTTKQENRIKPGRETITALLLMNLAIWMHDSFSAKKVRLNPSQVAYYDESTWAIIQAFTSPLSIFYRFHSSVCLADIWQEVYRADGTRSEAKTRMFPLVNMNGGHNN